MELAQEPATPTSPGICYKCRFSGLPELRYAFYQNVLGNLYAYLKNAGLNKNIEDIRESERE